MQARKRFSSAATRILTTTLFVGVIPSGAVLQAQRGISRAVPPLRQGRLQRRHLFSKLGISILSVWISLSLLIALPLPQSNQPAAPAQSPAAPLTLDEALRIVKQSKSDPKAAEAVIAERGVAFELEEKIQKKLQKAGATDDLLAEIWKVTPSGKAQMRALLTSPSGVEMQASAAEAMALKDIQNENAPAARLKLVDAFEKKFPTSPLLSYAYTEAARAHQQDGTLDEAVQYAKKSLKLDADNTYSLIILALVLPQPTLLKGNGNEIQAQLTEAAADANRALTLLDKLQKRPDETDDQFQTRKGSLTADCHFALGMGEMQRDQFDKAAVDYQAAISSTSKPTFQYFYRLAEAYASEGHVSEAIDSLRKASELAKGTPMQKVADDFMAELQQKPH